MELNPGQVILHERKLLGSDGATRAELEEVLALAASGELRPEIAAALPLEEAREAQRRLEAKEVVGRIVLEP